MSTFHSAFLCFSPLFGYQLLGEVRHECICVSGVSGTQNFIHAKHQAMALALNTPPPLPGFLLLLLLLLLLIKGLYSTEAFYILIKFFISM